MRISIETLKDDIKGTYNVLGERGLELNATDICEWHREGFLTDDEYHELRKYNRKLYAELPL